MLLADCFSDTTCSVHGIFPLGCVTCLMLAALLIISLPASAMDSPPSPEGAAGPGLPAWIISSRQLVVVTASDWDSDTGVLHWYERDSGNAWRHVDGPFAVKLGKRGQGWGVGLHSASASLRDEPLKVEGDGKAPSGAFTLPYAFAYDPRWIAGTSMPVVDVEPDLFCVDDPESPQYNTIQRLQADVPAPWKSAEVMQRQDGVYGLGIFVGHNRTPPVPGRGSCIFFHIEKSDGSPTVGCTAMNAGVLGRLIRWLAPAASPVLVQLPDPVYARLQKAWGLP